MPEKGDIVLVVFPFTDVSGNKRRPALVVGVSGEHAIVIFITSKATGERRWRVEVPHTGHTGLSVASAVRCDKIASFDLRIITGKIGDAPKRTMVAVDSKLRHLLEL